VDLLDAELLAHRLLKRHGLKDKGWKFKFDRAKTRLGVCSYSTKTISLSKHITAVSDFDSVEQTLFHEIAHALTPLERKKGKYVHHGEKWLHKAKELGYTGGVTSHNPLHEHNPLAIGLNSVESRSERLSRISGIAVAGDRITILGRNKNFSGQFGKVLKFCKKNYKVQLDSGTILFVSPVILKRVDHDPV
jgi:hypothetical protein